ncbi:MAG: hypothetical protein IJT06_06795 [Selenomonadaceae bacterium]|nr:hypothetical protein [Selenomonadaceae bacterium]
MNLLKIFVVTFALMIVPCQSFAEMPEITAGETYFDVMKGHYVLKDNVHVVINNKGFKSTVTANEARVNVIAQRCWAFGNVKFSHENYNLKCDEAYMNWQAHKAQLVGKIDFEGKQSVFIKSKTATFDWDSKEADFYGDVKVVAKKNLLIADGLKIENGNYAHVRYNVVENKILQLDKTFDIPKITIPDPDK